MVTVTKEVSNRVKELREKMLCLPALCIERGYWMTESYKETEGQPEIIRRAKALAKILHNINIHIDDGELIVGRTTSKRRGGPLIPELQWEWLLEEMDTISTRVWDRFAPLTEDEKTKMKEFLPYWRGKSLYEKWCAIVPENRKKLEHQIQCGTTHLVIGNHQGHVSLDYAMVLTKGLDSIKKQVDEELSKLNLAHIEELDKFQFLNAVNIALEAATSFAERHAQLAQSMAKKESNVQRKAELEMIAEICDWVPAKPARSFYEALQSVWLTHIVVWMEGPAAGISFGRPDQYLYPFYKQDIEQGRITKAEARELIELLYIKVNGSVIADPLQTAKTHGGFPITPNITLGGITKDGQDAVNELSYLFVDAEAEVGLSAEDIIIRVNNKTPDAFVMRACEVAKLLRGKFKFVSDETTIQQLLTDGKPVEYARDYILTGCSSPGIPGYSHDITGGIFNLPMMLELALNDGVSRLNGEQVGPKTGDPRKFKSYDQIWDAYRKQLEALLPVLILFRNVGDQLQAEFTPTPFLSALCHGCIEKGIDVVKGGTAPYLSHASELAGAPNVGDSLAAIKKAVFDDKEITIGRLIDALDKNFEGEEDILRILENAPKFGNDDDYVDSIVNDVLAHAAKEAAKYKGIAGAISNVGALAVTAHVPLGYMVGALPDGRKAGEPLAEGGISPYQGRNINGPTATMRSVAKLDLVKLTNSAVLNMKFSPDGLKDESKMRRFASLIRTFCETGGAVVQFNIVDTNTLRDAQKYPKKYRDLLVRVSTYSAYFVELSPELQNDIIRRMEFQEV